MKKNSEKLDLRIENFRSIQDTTLSLQPGVNILIGPNGSGKTCLLAALKFLRDIFVDGVGLAMAKSGGPLRNYHRGQSKIRFSVDSSYGQRIYNRKKKRFRFSWSVTIAQSGLEQIATIVEENLHIYVADQGQRTTVLSLDIDRKKATQVSASYKLGSMNAIGKDVFIGPEDSRQKRSKKEIYDSLERLLTRAMPELRASGDHSLLTYFVAIDRSLWEFLRRFVYLNEYNIVPDLARQATDQLPFAEIAPTGAGLSEVIHVLTNRHYHRLGSMRSMRLKLPFYYDYRLLNSELRLWRSRVGRHVRSPGEFESIIERINSELSLAVKSITGLSTEIDPTNGKRFTVFLAGPDRFYPEEVSDGTIKWLTILVSIFVQSFLVYMIEEPENFLHPWMQQQLIRLMREPVQPSVIYVLTTHSATVLNAAHIEEITAVSRDERGTHAERLQEREMIAGVLEDSNFGLGDLWVSGLLGAVPAGDE